MDVTVRAGWYRHVQDEEFGQTGGGRRPATGLGAVLDAVEKSEPLAAVQTYPWGMTVTVNLPDDAARRLTAEAARRGITVDELVAELVATLPTSSPEAAAPEGPGRRRLSFIGMGASGGGESVAERHREIIREHFANKSASDV